MPLVVTSSAFAEGQPIPAKFTCDGENISPALEWSGQPPDTKSLAIICDDPDAPSGPFTHWVLYDLDGDVIALAEGVQGLGNEGVNSFGKPGYGGPCPPPGKPHRYFFQLYALSVESIGEPGMTKQDALAAMKNYILSEGQLMGTYARQRK